MKTFLTRIALLLALFVLAPNPSPSPSPVPSAHADLEGAPFIPEIDSRFNKLEENYLEAAPGQKGHHVKQVAQATYDFAVNGGSSTVGSGLIDLGVQIPKNALITRAYAYTLTGPSTANAGTLGFYCNSTAPNDIMAQTALTSFVAGIAAVDGLESGAATAMSTITAACNIHAKIATGNLTSGKVTAFVEYVTHL